jgi:protein O-GlcNAc transferase
MKIIKKIKRKASERKLTPRYSSEGESEYAVNLYKKGIFLQDKGQLDDAISCYQETLKLNFRHFGLFNNLGLALQDKGQLDEAMLCYQEALKLNPEFAEAYYNLGNIFIDKKQLDLAVFNYRKSLLINPHYAEAYNNLGFIFKTKGQYHEALSCYKQALQYKPKSADVYFNLGTVLLIEDQLVEAISSFKKAIEINPKMLQPYKMLGHLLHTIGETTEAETQIRHVLEIDPADADSYSLFLLYMHYNPLYEAKTIFHEHLQFAKHCAESLSDAIVAHTNDRSPTRRLRVGYVSPDFRKQSVGFFIEPILASHNHHDFEIFCYHNLSDEDEMTERMKGYADHWRNIVDISDDEVSELVRNDNIDILVDLSGHTGSGRILVFAHKPAPVQISWIGYPNTTGLSTMDYKIVDNFTDPAGMTDHLYTEKLIRLPASFLCYLPYKDSPEVGELPAVKNGFITFGSFNILAKISPEVIRVWSDILRTIPNSRLIMKARNLHDSPTVRSFLNHFTEQGIDSERIELISRTPTYREHLAIYNRIDIALDTFPYNGTTTTFEAMWMGVPVVTLEGETHVSRVGVSLLTNVGLRDLVGKTKEHYTDITIDLANHLNTLHSLRNSLRQRMKQSPLTDIKQFTMNIEDIYRQIWKIWCES